MAANDPALDGRLHHLQVCAGCSAAFTSLLIPDRGDEDGAQVEFQEESVVSGEFAAELRRRLRRPAAHVICGGEPSARPTGRRFGATGAAITRAFPRFELRHVEEHLSARERDVVEGPVVHDFHDAAVARMLDTTANNVRQIRHGAMPKVLRGVLTSVFRMSNSEVDVLAAYYMQPVRSPEIAPAHMVTDARQRALSCVPAGTDLDRRHFEIMSKLVEAARRLDLHRRDAPWKTIVRAYFRAGQATRPDPLLEPELVRAEFEAMGEILEKFIRPAGATTERHRR